MKIPRDIHFLSKHSILMTQIVTYRQRRRPLRLQDRSTRLTERMRREPQLRLTKRRPVITQMPVKKISLTNIASRQRKHQIIRIRQPIFTLPNLPHPPQSHCHTPTRSLSLHPRHHLHTLTDNTLRLPLHTNLTSIKIHTIPLQSTRLTHTQPGTNHETA